MPKLSKPAQNAWKVLLSEPMAPSALRAHADCLAEVMGEDFVTQNFPMGREAHLACQLAAHLGATSVWMGDAPDCGMMLSSGETKLYEITEALPTGRKRYDEYRATRARIDAGGSHFEQAPILTVDEACSALAAAASLKAAKAAQAGSQYQRSWGLLIYFNPGFVESERFGFDGAQREVKGRILSDTAAAKAVFAEVWVLWDGRLFRC